MWYAMSGIWTEDGGGWTLSLPVGFPDEATLHDLIEQTPEMLPLSGAPFLVILSREVPLGSGYADLVGVETSGRPVIVEIKLEQNRDARRAVVAQILAYAAYLHGTTREQLEDLVGSSLRRRGYESVVDAMASVQEDALDGDEFTEALDEHLREGRFRLVFVLDAAPQELMTLVAYLEHVTEKLVIDLVAVSSFNVGSASVMLPQRVTPERHEVTIKKTRRREPAATYQGQREVRGQYHRGSNGAPKGSLSTVAVGPRVGEPRASNTLLEPRQGTEAVRAKSPSPVRGGGISHHLE